MAYFILCAPVDTRCAALSNPALGSGRNKELLTASKPSTIASPRFVGFIRIAKLTLTEPLSYIFFTILAAVPARKIVSLSPTSKNSLPSRGVAR